jgi:hypothetical protein
VDAIAQVKMEGRSLTKSKRQKAKGKRQKAKGRNISFFRFIVEEPSGQQDSALLPFAFCLLPFDFFRTHFDFICFLHSVSPKATTDKPRF